MTVTNAIRLARPTHWIKNIIVLFPVVFAMRAGSGAAWAAAGVAAAALCLASSAIYALNDVVDAREDRLHPNKRNRPVASGQVSPAAAIVQAIVLLAGALTAAALLGMLPLAVVVSYVLLQVAYSFYFKRIMLADVICIALGFVLRAVAGAVAIAVVISPWLFVCTFTICLFMGFCKRSNEIATLGGRDQAAKHRPTLHGYTPELLTHLITLSATLAIVAFLMYATSARTVENLGTHFLVYTLPIVSYAVMRVAMLSMNGSYSDPTDIVLRDGPFQFTVALWVVAAAVVVFRGAAIQSWMAGLL